jgi:hypothetical protein
MPLEEDAAYECPSCGETNYIAVDPAAGHRQRTVEDCPVCCRPIEFEIVIDRDGDASVQSAELAQ